MITTTKAAIGSLDVFHQALVEIMIEKGLVEIIDENEKVPGLGGAGTGQTRQAPLKEAGR